ncbi:MAG: MmcQ/YjbR family DNA-binding protein [Ruminococcus sp.]|nr:MmcQ/YjbR family DNA-binding protein [Ruminococcus sp.]
MKIEEELFQKYLVDENKLVAYGFVPVNDKLTFTKDLPDENFQIIIEYNDSFSGRIIDLSIGEEYVNYRREDASGFSAEIKDKFVGLLKDIRDNCCVNQYYESEQAKRILAYIREVYGDTPEFLWKAYPTFAAIRKKSNRKWYALLGSVPLDKVNKDASSSQKVEVINVKVGDVKSLLEKKGYYPGYHMNKKCWVSVILDDKVADAEIYQLIDDSYNSV